MSNIYVMQNAKGETNSQEQAEFDPISWGAARVRPEVSSGEVQEVVASETRLTDPKVLQFVELDSVFGECKMLLRTAR